MKELKDYLHLYLNSGISVYIFTIESITDGFLENYRRENPNGVFNPVLTFENYSKFIRDGYKPILRRLSDMTEEEALHIAGMYSGAHAVKRTTGTVNNFFYFDCDFRSGPKGYSEILIIHNGEAWYQHYFENFPGKRTIRHNVIRQFDVFHYLLKQGFDLFNLIDEGLAADAKQ